ncbi:YafY family transcriptional regulator [Saccharopolyspora rhizosphaerae]|uniref:YafY family transcriptional regulator n=1 Tax=Saccharopolyspora rhizosphaerae TaxID=2492662 RepID=A0A426JU86_9PSEU|nr:YafY family protein [Saccharopolyspora rhizosphaerae]RRO16755.1 YafY family transcriptional regulator [Saccharopolyspora rhizosphaerae]
MRGTSARLLALLSLLQARRDWPGSALAERLEVSDRTVRRDVDRLRELGYPIATTKGPDGGYRLEAGSNLPPLLFDDEQAIALAIALRIATTAGAGIEEAAGRALTTVRQVMPSRLRHRIDTLHVTAVERGTRHRVDSELLMTLSSAVHARAELRFDYTGSAASRRAQPHHLITWGGRWYLIAWDLDREDWRTFRADRITPRTPTGPRFSPRALPGGDVSAFVRNHFQGSETWPCLGDVILDLPAATVSRYTYEGVVEELPDGRCKLTLGSWSWRSLAAEIGKYDADVEVVGPSELRTACAQLAERYAAAAGGAPS